MADTKQLKGGDKFLAYSWKGLGPSRLERPRGRSVRQLVLSHHSQEAESGQE